jgi:bifunctional NMN adenylyltransferase/nudix hydrolase
MSTLKEKTATADVGVIIGRFQVPFLHEQGHCSLIETVKSNHSKVIIFLGVPGINPVPCTKQYPLDFESRKQMILEKFPDVIVTYIQDTKYNEVWSKKLDTAISALVGPSQSVVLYGSRDSFMTFYSGKYPVKELIPDAYISGTSIRNKIATSSVKSSEDFRAGAIWAIYNQFDKVHACVDVAIVDRDKKRILLARKEGETEYRFVGGFSDPVKDNSYEDAAKREVMEETHLEIGEPHYVTSMKVSDWRFRGEKDKIFTNFYWAEYVFGSPTPDDDICELRWFDFDEIRDSNDKILLDGHKILFDKMLDDSISFKLL